MRVIQEADLDELTGFTIDNISDGISDDFGFRSMKNGTDTLTVNITNDSNLKVSFDIDDLGIIEGIKSLKYNTPKDITSIDLLQDESKIEELSAMLISAIEVSNYIKEKLS